MSTPRGAMHRDLEQRLRDLERRVRDLTTKGLTRRQFTLSSGDFTVSGGDLVLDGGTLLLLDTDGSTLFRVGPQDYGDRGVSVVRDDGSEALGIRKPFSASDPQLLTVKDNEGNAILQETLFGDGLEKPYLPMPMQPVGPAGTGVTVGPYGLERAVTSGAFTDVFRWQGTRQNQWCRPVLNVRCSDTATAAQLRVVDEATGNALDGFFLPPWVGDLAAGSTADQLVTPPYGLRVPGAFGASVAIKAQARVSAGTGTVTVAVRSCEGSSA